MTATDPLAAAPHTTRTAPGVALLDVANSSDFVYSLAVRSNGAIVVAGASVIDGPPRTLLKTTVQLDAAGRLEAGQGAEGRTTLNLPGYGLLLLADGSAVTLQSEPGGENWNLSVARIRPDGTSDGNYTANSQSVIPDDYEPDFTSVQGNADGTLLVSSTTRGHVDLLQLDTDGTLDTDFGTAGRVTVDQRVVFAYRAFSIALDNGQVLLAGDLWADDLYRPGLVRVNADGSLDTRFGDNGRVLFSTEALADFRGAMAVQADGKIILAGSNQDEHFSVVRLNPDGSHDQNFATDGVATVDTLGAAHFAYGIAVQADGKIVLAGNTTVNDESDYAVLRLSADGRLDTAFASADGRYHVEGSATADDLQGLAQAETLRGLAGNDLLQGNAGRDLLVGGQGADIFRFVAREDSYRTASDNGSDRILDFAPDVDRIDLIDLGYSGLGNGRNGTLAVQVNAEGSRTYLKSFETDASGQRFELALEGDLATQLNTTNVIFAPFAVRGTAGADNLAGTVLQEVLQGLGGNDRLNGMAGDDVLLGGEGRDRLSGGSGDDVFRFTSIEDSYRTTQLSAADVILDFTQGQDRMDLAMLGFTGLGNGLGGTLQVSYNTDLNRTYLKNFHADAAGHRFELSLDGEHGAALDERSFVFASVGITEPEIVTVGMVDPLAMS
jgi:serralysin